MFLQKVYNFIFRRILSRVADPLVPYDLGRYAIKLPLSHELPYYQRMHEHYSLNIVRIAKMVILKYPDLRLIDIGANVGDTVIMVRNSVDCPVLAIEGDSRYFSIMQMNCVRIDDVVLQKALVGEFDQKVSGQMLGGKGTSRFSNNGGSSGFDVVTLDAILSQHPRFLGSKLLKIDTDGFELRIIRGAYRWISRVKPVIFFEYDPAYIKQQGDAPVSIFSVLRDMGYRFLLVYHNTGEYMFSVDLEDRNLIEDMHAYFSGRKSKMYADICAFHQEDADLGQDIRTSELNYFREARYDR